MPKKINLTITTCSKCPHCKYNSFYDRCRDSGFDCSKSNRRIIDDYDYSNENNPNAQYVYDPEKDIFKGNPNIAIPDWCPL